MTRAARPVSDPDRPHRLVVALAIAAFVVTFVRVGGTPFTSEDWTQIADNGRIGSFLGAIDPSREPLRPFQHAFLWCVAHAGLDPAGDVLPWLAHAVGFALHATAALLLYRLARLAGLAATPAAVAVALFVAFPNVKSLAWTAAVGNPARVCFELGAFVAFARHVRAPSWRTGLAGIVLHVLATSGHESAMLFPALLVAWILCVEGETLRAGFARAWRAARDPWVLLLVATCAAHVVHLATRAQRHHRVKSLDALPANVVKAATSLLPEFARDGIVDGFRGGGVGFVLAGLAFALLVAGVLLVAWRSRFGRFVLAVVACELGLAILGAGFVQRYAYLSSAFVALGLAAWSARGGRVRVALVLAVGVAWAHDAWVDARDLRAVRGLRDAVVARVVAAQGPERAPVVLVDPPDMIGAERDVPLFNWGLEIQLRALGVGGELVLTRTRAFATSSDVERVEPAWVEAERRAGARRVVDLSDLRQP